MSGRYFVQKLAQAIVTVVAAIVGDSVGYEIGKHVGTRVLKWDFLQHRRSRVEQAQDFLSRRGGSAVFLGRWVAFFRAVMPALAGTARMPYRKFLAWNAAGGLVWGVAVVMLGYLAGALLTSITLGLVIVFAAEDSGITKSAKHTVNPALDLAFAGLLLAIAFVLHSGRDRAVRERRAARKAGAKARAGTKVGLVVAR